MGTHIFFNIVNDKVKNKNKLIILLSIRNRA